MEDHGESRGEMGGGYFYISLYMSMKFPKMKKINEEFWFKEHDYSI